VHALENNISWNSFKASSLNDQFIALFYLGPSEIGVSFEEFEKFVKDAINNPNIDINGMTDPMINPLNVLIGSTFYKGSNGSKQRFIILQILLNFPEIDINKFDTLSQFIDWHEHFGEYASEAMILLLSKGAKINEDNINKINESEKLKQAYNDYMKTQPCPIAPPAPFPHDISKGDTKKQAEQLTK
jgi:hypothetical protein